MLTRTIRNSGLKFATIGLALACMAALFSPGQLKAAEVWETVPPPPPMPVATEAGLADVNGIKMYYAVYGKGDPVLLIHGGLGYADVWAAVVADLMKDHEVIVADTRGHGRSTRTAEPFDYHTMAEDYVALLSFLKVEKTALVGWSDGGIIGFDIAINHPEKLTKLFAQAGQTSTAGSNPTFGDAATTGVYVGMMAEAYAKVSPTPDKFEAFLNDMVALYGVQPNYPDATVASIKTPTTIAVGEHDEAVLPEHSKHLSEIIPGAKLLIVPGVSHFWLFQDPAGYVKAVRGFLAQN